MARLRAHPRAGDAGLHGDRARGAARSSPRRRPMCSCRRASAASRRRVAGHLARRVRRAAPDLRGGRSGARRLHLRDRAGRARPVKIAHGEPTVMAMLECYEPSPRRLARAGARRRRLHDGRGRGCGRGDEPPRASGRRRSGDRRGRERRRRARRCSFAPPRIRRSGRSSASTHASRVFAINTEGATDPQRYAELVGKDPDVMAGTGARMTIDRRANACSAASATLGRDRPRRRRPARPPRRLGRRQARARPARRLDDGKPGSMSRSIASATSSASGRTPATPRTPVLIGSHIDTVIDAGIYDGCYGVLAGLEVIETLKAAGFAPARPIAVAAFTNEEGVRYAPDMMGSLVYAGGLPVEAALATVGTDGAVLGAELARIGYAGAQEPGFLKPHAYVELHVEQGPVLEREGVPIGAVENLQGISWQRVTIDGVANHAGTTPMSMRQRRRPRGRPRRHVPARPGDGLEHADGRDGRLHAASSRTPSTSSRRARPSRSTCAIPTSSACRREEAALADYLERARGGRRRDDRGRAAGAVRAGGLRSRASCALVEERRAAARTCRRGA